MTPRYNFDDTVPNVPGDIVPDDTYDGLIVAVIPGVTQKGTKWDVFTEIVAGEHAGNKIKDSWFWYGKGPERIMVIFKRLGVEIPEGDADYSPDLILNAPVRIEVQTKEEEYRGEVQQKCTVRWDGYSLDDSRPWAAPQPKPTKPEQGSVFDAGSTPF